MPTLLGLVCAEGQRKHRLAQEREDLILAEKLQRRELLMPSRKKRKVAQMKEKCIFLPQYENLNRQPKPCTLRLPSRMHPTSHSSASRKQNA